MQTPDSDGVNVSTTVITPGVNKRRPGRESDYTQEITDEICIRISHGEPLAQICRDDHMPAWRTVYDWRDAHPSFAAAIAYARKEGFDAIAERVRATSRGLTADNGGDSMHDVARDKLIIETDLKLLAKWSPQKYGDSVQMKHSGAIGHFDPTKLGDEQLNELERVLGPIAASGSDAADGSGGEGSTGG